MDALRKSLQEHLAMRRGLGFKLERSGRWLEDFISFMERRHARHISCTLALAWAQQAKNAQSMYRAQRLSAVRGFASYLSVFDPRTEIPPTDLLPYRRQRRSPYLYTDEELQLLLKSALKLFPPSSIRPRTYFTMFGLLIATGMRIGEAINLKLQDVDFKECLLTIRGSKWGKDRLVPIHPSTRNALDDYRRRRVGFFGECSESPFFVTTKGARLSKRGVHNSFRRLARRIGLGAPSGKRAPRIHDFRHRFAVMTLVGFYRRGKDPVRYIPVLSTFLGHVKPSDTYWYLEQHPELMKQAMQRLELRSQGLS